MSEPSTAVEVDELVKRYGELTAVDAVSFTVRRGEFFGLLGPNGAGKSTTMRMVYQVTPPTSGTLRVFGLDTGAHARAIKQRLGVVPQMDNLDEELRVVDNLMIYARFNGIRGAGARARADELLAFTELGEKRRSRVVELSGGMKRRLTLARGLMNDPELLILDEPTTGLDPQVRLNLWSKLDELRSRGITLMMSTHYMDEAERLCDRLVIMDHGRIIAEGEPRALIRDNLPPFVIEARTEAGGGHTLEHSATQLGLELARSGDRVSVFVSDPDGVMARLRGDGFALERAFVRPANLEDVFLKLTGRSLRE
jgi:lipooligosaccharide transport system ATP-binding protein